jgi:hypothetical protein
MPRKQEIPADIKRQIRRALYPSVAALRRIARYRLEPSLNRRMRELGERKEFLGKKEHAELLALLAFTQQRTLEKLEARAALKRLNEVLTGVQ